MKRKIVQDLEKFFLSKTEKAFLLKGTRQVGKTYIINEFITHHYDSDHTIYINFLRQPEAKDFFEAPDGDSSLEPKKILRRILNNPLYQNVKQDGAKIALFLDEIQECPKAITSLKFFALERKKYDVYASGSYLGFTLMDIDKGESFPTGYVQRARLYGLDFEEFLWANGYSETYTESLKKSFKDGVLLDASAHNELLDMFHKYVIVGSLPEPINVYLETKDFKEVRKIAQSLYEDYCTEMNKHLSFFSREHYGDGFAEIMKIKNKAVFDSIPSQLRQQNKKFMYRRVSRGGRERMYLDNILWLKTAGLIDEIDNIKKPSLFLSDFKEEDDFKLYFFDTGILISRFDYELIGDILSPTKDVPYEVSLSIGGIYENAISNILAKYFDEDKDYFFYKQGNEEIDFAYQEGRRIALIEVKSGENIKPKSLKNLVQERKDIIPIRISQKQIKEKTYVEYPFYAFALLHSK